MAPGNDDSSKRQAGDPNDTSESLEALVRNAPLAVLSLDRVGRVLSWNPAAERMFGWEAQEVMGRELPIVPTGKEPEFRGIVDTVLSGKSLTAVELSRHRKDGRPIEISVSTAPLRDAKGNIYGVIAVTQDITDRKHAQAAARLGEARLAALFELSQKSEATEDELVDYALEEAVRLTGSELGYFHFVAEDQTTLMLCRWSSAVTHNGLSNQRHPLSDAGVWADCARLRRPVVHNHYEDSPDEAGLPVGHAPILRHMSAPVLVDDQVVAIAGVVNKPSDYDESDVRQLQLFLDGLWKLLQQKRAILEQQRLEEQLRVSQRMDAIGRLAAGIAHDFNNLLAVIVGYGELLQRDMPADGPHREYVKEISDAGERAARLTRQLLAFSRKQVLHSEVLSLNHIVQDLERMLHRTLGEHIELVTDLKQRLGAALLDRGQVEQVLLNLVVNARDAMPQGGTITVTTANVTLDASACAALGTLAPGRYVSLRVQDTGEGIDPATRERVFDPFFTTKAPGEGTGLGLATVYGIVSQSGGAIQLDSEKGSGTTFTIYFPRVEADATPSQIPPPPDVDLHGSETILVTEDDGSVRRLVQKILTDAGYRVLVAANAGEALLQCEQWEGTIHLLLTDVVMPHMSGKVLVDRVASMRPDMKILYMSGFEASVVACHGLQGQRSNLLSKPFSAAELTRMVRAALDETSQS
jgi:PAS domain S-box-containing protein